MCLPKKGLVRPLDMQVRADSCASRPGNWHVQCGYRRLALAYAACLSAGLLNCS